MIRPSLEVADIVRAHQAEFVASRGGRVSGAQKRVLKAIASCRTSALGGHVQRCDECHHTIISYNSCRNRHCPKCQWSARAEWLSDRERDLLPVEYFHVVFTIPKELAAIALQNKKVVFEILFRSAAETLLQVAADPKHLGAKLGILAILHTWGQTLEHHPHIHCVVPGGGLSPDGSRWVSCKAGFFLPVRILGRVFRGKFLCHLKRAFKSKRLKFHGNLVSLENHTAFYLYLKPLYEKDWFVYSKRPFNGPSQVLRYLARYTHRVAISNRRLIAMENGRVSFTWKDYSSGCRKRIMDISAVEFIRRFLIHILPRRFVRIRNYGLFANRVRSEKVALCRQLLKNQQSAVESVPLETATDEQNLQEKTQKCPVCRLGTMVCILTFGPGESVPDPLPEACDTS